MRKLLVLALLLTGVVTAKPAPLASKDAAFTFAPPEPYKIINNPNPTNMLGLVCQTSKSLIVVTRTKPVKQTAAQLVKSLPRQVPWHITAARLGRAGSQPAAIFEADGVMKDLPTYKTVMAVLSLPKAMYTFQIHYVQGDAAIHEAWLKGVTWK